MDTTFVAVLKSGRAITEGYGKVPREEVKEFAVVREDGAILWSATYAPVDYRRRTEISPGRPRKVCHVVDLGDEEKVFIHEDGTVVSLPGYQEGTPWYYPPVEIVTQ